MNGGDVERLAVDESSDLQRADAVVCTLNVVAVELIAIKASRIDGSVASEPPRSSRTNRGGPCGGAVALGQSPQECPASR